MAKYVLVIFISSVVSYAVGQTKNDVVFQPYPQLEKGILAQLKNSKAISSFTSMRKQKRQAIRIFQDQKVSLKKIPSRRKKLDAPNLIELVEPSVLLICEYRPGAGNGVENLSIFATGIVLSSDGICLTNYHVLQRLLEKEWNLAPQDSLLFAATHSGNLYSIDSILSFNKEADFAYFKLNTNQDRLTPIPFGNDLPKGATIHTLSHPDGNPYYYTKGVISRNVSGSTANPSENRVEISAEYALGSSGGPIFDDCGNLIAMISSTRSIFYQENNRNSLQMLLRRSIPCSSLKRILRWQ